MGFFFFFSIYQNEQVNRTDLLKELNIPPSDTAPGSPLLTSLLKNGRTAATPSATGSGDGVQIAKVNNLLCFIGSWCYVSSDGYSLNFILICLFCVCVCMYMCMWDRLVCGFLFFFFLLRLLFLSALRSFILYFVVVK